MIQVQINGNTYPLCMTIKAAAALEERYGEITKLTEGYKGKSQVGLLREVLFQLHLLMEGGRDYAALSFGEAGDLLSEDALGVLCPISRTGEFQTLILAAVSEGFRREVETEPDRKNGNATQSKKR